MPHINKKVHLGVFGLHFKNRLCYLNNPNQLISRNKTCCTNIMFGFDYGANCQYNHMQSRVYLNNHQSIEKIYRDNLSYLIKGS